MIADSRAQAVANVVRQAQHDLKLQSVVVRVTQDGRDVWTGALGQSMTGVPARPDMRFRAGSVGIAFMNILLLQLVDERRVSLDDHLSRWLPEVPHASEITLRTLGDSTSGIRDYVKDPGFQADLLAHPFKQWTPQELLSIANPSVLLYPPGKNFSYSHANYVLLGAALERITHTRLDHLLEQRIYSQFGLRATSNGYTPTSRPRFCTPSPRGAGCMRSRRSGTPRGPRLRVRSSPWTSAIWRDQVRRSGSAGP
ncbi:serine hydrolase domain-containing protein [Catenulispora yoronensis]